MTIETPDDARRYLLLGPRASLVRLAAEGVEAAGTIAAVQGNPLMAAEYRAAAAVLREALS